jgi:hypothetical protein
MASYFRQVPNFEYVSRNSGEKYISEYIPVKNLFKRGKLREDIFGNLSFFEKYSIIGDERPDNVAYKFYDDETLDWVILLSNNILNIQTEWPMTQRTFDKVMLEKYRSIDITNMDFLTDEDGNSIYDKEEIERTKAFNDESVYQILYGGIHHYETKEIKNSLGVTVLKSGLKIQPTWKTNGNFIETINSIINSLSAYTYDPETNKDVAIKTVTVFMRDNIPAFPGDQVLISGVSEKEYNGRFIIKEIFQDYFTYDLPNPPNNITPIVSTSGKEQVIYTVSENSLNSSPTNPRYYEYWDPGLGYPVVAPSSSFIREVTNYEYENQLQEEKRNIYVLKPRYLNVIFNDMDTIMPYKKGSQQYVTENLKKGDNIRLYT